MALFNALFNSNISSVEEAFKAKDITSANMKDNINECLEIYVDGQTDTEDDCQRIPVIIVNKLTKTMFCEYTYSAKDENVYKILKELDKIKKKTMQDTFIGGECLLKPIIKEDGITFRPIRRDCFIPFARDIDGTITDVGTVAKISSGGKYYTLLERRTAGENLTITTKLYCSDNKEKVGTQVPLNTIDKYKDIPEEIVLPISGIGLIQIKTPIENCVDLSNDGCCIYSPALKLIRNIAKNEQQFNDEYDIAQSRIIVSKDMLRTDNTGLRELYDKVFTALEDDPENVGIHIFNPEIRFESYITRRNEYLKSIESLIGFRRGLLSNVEEVEKTATEITSTAGEYNLTILDLQSVWTEAVIDALKISQQLMPIYFNTGLKFEDPEEDIVIDYGDGVLYNRTSVFNELYQMTNGGYLKPEMLLAWYYELPHSTPEDIEEIKNKYLPAINPETDSQI